MVYTLPDLLTKNDRSIASKKALIDGQRSISYFELQQRALRLAPALEKKGARKGDRVAIFLPRSIEAVVALFAAWLNGNVGVIVNEVLKTRQVKYILEHSQATLLVTDSYMLSAIAEHPLEEDRVLKLDEAELPESEYTQARVIGADPALIIYTSGSTGMPKGIMLSHSNLVAGAHIVSDYLHLKADDVLISLLPFSFDYGLNQLLTALLAGGTLVIQRSVLPVDICATLSKERVTGMAAVPLLWQQLAGERSPFISTQFPSLRYITNTGGHMPEGITRLYRKSHPMVRIYLMFGLTEAFRSTYLPPEMVDIRPASIGKAIPNVEILILNEKGEVCKPGEVGEIVHRGACISMGYWRDEKSTKERFRLLPPHVTKSPTGEIGVYSGDYAKTDEEGFIYYVGRKDNVIKSRGVRVSPEEVEEYIHASGLVRHIVVFAVPKDEVDNSIIAAVVPKDKSIVSEEGLIKYCRREMPEHLRPDAYCFLDKFPVTTSGKPDRVSIKEMYIRGEISPPR